jgi:hypothetical protein
MKATIYAVHWQSEFERQEMKKGIIRDKQRMEAKRIAKAEAEALARAGNPTEVKKS